MDISNKTLAIFLVAAIVVSVAGTMISLNKLQSVSYTGFATTATGNVSVNIQSQLSITTSDGNTINFGQCTPQSGSDTTINSETQPSICESGTYPKYILVRNDGNVDANVTVQFSKVGKAQSGTFLDSTESTSSIAYKVVNDSSASYSGGCIGSYPSSYTTVSTANSEIQGCTDLKYGDTYNSFETAVQIVVPYDAPVGSDSVILTYTAHNV